MNTHPIVGTIQWTALEYGPNILPKHVVNIDWTIQLYIETPAWESVKTSWTLLGIFLGPWTSHTPCCPFTDKKGAPCFLDVHPPSLRLKGHVEGSQQEANYLAGSLLCDTAPPGSSTTPRHRLNLRPAENEVVAMRQASNQYILHNIMCPTSRS